MFIENMEVKMKWTSSLDIFGAQVVEDASSCITEVLGSVQKKSRLHGCEPDEGFLNLCQF